MLRRPVIVIAEREERGTYMDLTLRDERVEFIAREHGIESVRQTTPDLVILDCGFDAARGIKILQEIKQLRSDLPVIFLTAKSSEEIILKAFKAGVRGYFKRPVNMNDLGETVGEILRLKRETSGKRFPLSETKKENTPEEFTDLSSDLPKNLHLAIHYMKKNLTNSLTLEQIAREACMSKFHFCRIFKKHTSMSPMQFMAKLRIDKAMRLLWCCDHKISIVAIQSGFNNLSEFNKQFKKVTGKTPSEYRKFTPDARSFSRS